MRLVAAPSYADYRRSMHLGFAGLWQPGKNTDTGLHTFIPCLVSLAVTLCVWICHLLCGKYKTSFVRKVLDTYTYLIASTYFIDVSIYNRNSNNKSPLWLDNQTLFPTTGKYYNTEKLNVYHGIIDGLVITLVYYELHDKGDLETWSILWALAAIIIAYILVYGQYALFISLQGWCMIIAFFLWRLFELTAKPQSEWNLQMPPDFDLK